MKKTLREVQFHMPAVCFLQFVPEIWPNISAKILVLNWITKKGQECEKFPELAPKMELVELKK